MMNWEKLAKERGEEIVALKTEMQKLAQQWSTCAAVLEKVGNEKFKEHYLTIAAENKSRAQGMRGCAEKLLTSLERCSPPPSKNSETMVGLCDEHQWPYGVDVEDSCRPICAWCEALRADALERQVVALNKGSWIQTKERLPEHYTAVLCFVNCQHDGIYMRLGMLHRARDQYQDDYWMTVECSPLPEPTHWMDLPLWPKIT